MKEITHYLHTQKVSSNEWIVNHKLNQKYVNITVVDFDDILIQPLEVELFDSNTTYVRFTNSKTGRVVVSGDSIPFNYYLHNQAISSNIWVVKHNLQQKYVSVTVVNHNNELMLPLSVEFINSSELIVQFSNNSTGRVIVNADGYDWNNRNRYHLHNQTVGSNQWVVNHNLNQKYVSVTTINDNDIELIPLAVEYLNNNQVMLTFSNSIVGNAVTIADGSDWNERNNYFLFEQNTPSTQWVVSHNLDQKYPSVTVVNDEDKIVYPNYVIYNDNGDIIINFNTPNIGKVILVGTISNKRFYIHNQNTESNEWYINHNLGQKFIGITVMNENNEVFIPSVTEFITDTLAKLTFSTNLKGKATCIADGYNWQNDNRYYLHNQSTASMIWNVTHNLNQKYVNVYVINDLNIQVMPYEIEYIDDNSINIEFNTNQIGKVIVVGDDVNLSKNIYHLHEQVIPSNEWTITHKLKQPYVNITIIDDTDKQIHPTSIQYIDGKTIKVYFTVDFSGYAILNGENLNARYYLHDNPVPTNTWIIEHNLNQRYVHCDVYIDDILIIPNEMEFVNENIIHVTFADQKAGKAVITGNDLNITNRKTYHIHEQDVSATTWYITHGLNQKYVQMTIIDENNKKILPGYINFINNSTTEVGFTNPTSGKVVASYAGGGMLNSYIIYCG